MVTNQGVMARTSITINADAETVWDALLDPAMIKQYMFDVDVITDWQAGSSIVWRGTWEGQAFEDKGKILRHVPRRLIRFTHFSPTSGLRDVPENYHIITIEVVGAGQLSTLILTQDNNASEAEREDSKAAWQIMLERLKVLLEA